MKSIDSIRDRLASILRETGNNTTGLDCSARRRAVMALLRAAVAEIDGAEWDVREAADYLGVSKGWVHRNVHPGLTVDPAVRASGFRIRYDAMRKFKERIDAKREEALNELARLTQELGDDE